MPGQVERQLHAGRKLRKALVNPELEVERAALVPKHDCGRDRRIACPQRHDLALAAFGERHGGAADKSGVALALDHGGAALSPPSRGFQGEKNLKGGRDVCGRARRVEMDLAMLGKAMALAAQFLQFPGAEGVEQQGVGVARRIQAGAGTGSQ